MRWRLTAFTWNDPTTKSELRAASSRLFTWKLLEPSTLTFSIPGDHPQALFIQELVTDVMVSLNGVDIELLRCWNGSDNCQESGYAVNFNFDDYRAVLQRRKILSSDPLSYSGEQAFIAWSLIVAVQGRTNGDYGITRGVGTSTGVTVSNVLVEGQFAGKEIDSMAKRDNGFEWNIGPDLKFNVFYPNRGANNGEAIEYKKSIANFTRTKNPSSFANDVLCTGSNTTTPSNATSAGIGTDPAGRWDAVISFPDVVIQATLDAKATYEAGLLSTVPITYTCELAAGFWKGPAHIGLGDTVRVRVNRGRIADDLNLRVLEIAVSIDDDGDANGAATDAGETVKLTLG